MTGTGGPGDRGTRGLGDRRSGSRAPWGSGTGTWGLGTWGPGDRTLGVRVTILVPPATRSGCDVWILRIPSETLTEKPGEATEPQ